MNVGVVKEIKPAERRVALTPGGALAAVDAGHHVLVEAGAGAGSGYPDAMYHEVGARVVDSAAEVWAEAELLLKVKEPIPSEYEHLRKGQTLFTYLHLAPERRLVEALLHSGTTAIAYETVQTDDGRLPLLAPMSEVAGRLASQVAAHHLLAPFGGPGTLMGGVPGVAAAKILVIGGGVVGTHAARVAEGMGAEVTILERSVRRLTELEEHFGTRVRVLMSDPLVLRELLSEAHAVIGAVLLPGARAPQLVRREDFASMRQRAILVDVAIDQGGCFECSRPTTHSDPTFTVDDVVHYCVANMPGAVPITSTRALTNVTLPYVLHLAAGVDEAVAACTELARGVNIADGRIVNAAVAAAHPDLSPGGLLEAGPAVITRS
jgi:alanine dehydrogenase